MSQRSPRHLLTSFWQSDNVGPVVLAITVGLLGGFGAILFRWLIDLADQVFFNGGSWALPFLGDAYIVVLPAIGLVAVAYVVRRWAPEAQGHGVPEVMYAVRREGGRIRPRVAVIKALASAVCIGSGGSVGREGPIVQIGCSVGSSLGQWLGLDERRVRLLVACGAAAGVGGTFNAPIAGVIFACEVILGSFAARSFGLVVISSVVSTAIVRALLDESTAFVLTEVFTLESYLELPVYLGLGLVAGLVALGFVRALYGLEGFVARFERHWLPLAIAGGLVVGVLGLIGIRYLGGRYLLGVGYDGIEAILQGGAGMTILSLLLLVVLKILATSTTLAAGGSGGVFAPSIFIGAMLGGAVGLALNGLFPGGVAPPGAYALVGMGAVFAGAAHAPVTSILILFEMTDDYQIILPLMIAVVISYLVASKLAADSIYTVKLRRRGGFDGLMTQTSALDAILVVDAMEMDHETVGLDAPIADLAARFHGSHVRSCCVLDEEGRLAGIVTEFDVESALIANQVEGRTAGDLMTRELVTCTPDQRLRDVLVRAKDRDVHQLPVVAKDDPTRLVGVLRRREILWAYGEMATEHRALLDKSGIEFPEGDAFKVELAVRPEHSRLCDKKVQTLGMPENCLCILLRRAERSIIPRGSTTIEPGDVLVLVTLPESEEKLRRWVAKATS